MAGRPRFEIDFVAVEKLAGMMCTVGEIANYLGCSRRTLERSKEFQEHYQKGLDIGRMAIRRAQYRKAVTAKNPDTTMLIWLGKVYLGQTEKFIQELSGVNPVKITEEQTGLFDEKYLLEKTS